MSTNGKRRTWSAAEKLRIVLAGMQPDVEVSDLCRREGLNPVQFYTWKKQLLGSATRVFEDRRGRPDAREQRREAENQRLKNVIAEITAENLDLKKLGRQSLFDEGILKRSEVGRRVLAEASAQRPHRPPPLQAAAEIPPAR
jgi:transposase-like protein